MAASNKAIFLASGTPNCPLEIEECPLTLPGPHELVVKNHFVSINPVDAYKQLLGDELLPYITWPHVPGSDLAGEVVYIGSAVTRFAVGQRVMAYAAGTLQFANRPAEGAFQHYSVVREHMTARIPEPVSYERACVLPLCLSTAAYGLFHDGYLGLNLPTVPTAKPTGQALVITSGASSVGACAIQLAVAAGYEVYSTASSRNFDLVRRLGASGVFDYHDDDCAAAISSALKGKKVVGALAVNSGGVGICADVLRTTDGVKFIADAGPPPPHGYPDDIRSRFIDSSDLVQPEGVVANIFGDFVPKALASGQLIPEPEPSVVGRGLESIQKAYNLRLQGVSAQKIVVALH